MRNRKVACSTSHWGIVGRTDHWKPACAIAVLVAERVSHPRRGWHIDAHAELDDRRLMPTSHAIIDTLREKFSIAALVCETVNLVSVGEEFRGHCSAHPDRERGLLVNNAKGFYRCFACGRQGDVVQWTKETARCDEEEAIALLCKRAGLAGPTR